MESAEVSTLILKTKKGRGKNMKKQEIVSVDFGYGYTKAISSNGKRIIFPSVVGSGRERGLASFIKNKKATEEQRDLTEMHIKVDGKHFYVGEMAEKNSNDSSRIFDRERYNHEYTPILYHVAIQQIVEPDVEEVILLAGLPLNYYKSQVKPFKEKLLGKSLEIEWISGLPQQRKKVNIAQVEVFPQGYSAVLSTIQNSEGKFINSDLLEEGNQLAIIDIGFRTTDVCVVEMKGKGAFSPLIQYSATIDQGVVNLYEFIKKAYQEKTQGSDVSDSKIKRILEKKYINYKGKKIDLSKEVEEARQSVTNGISDSIKMLWKDELDTIDQIYVIGGGSYEFGDYMQKNFDNRLKTIVDSQFANAISYYRMWKILTA